ncbi:MAG: MATE family efflux transporter [Granulosicoccaceae bacterium]
MSSLSPLLHDPWHTTLLRMAIPGVIGAVVMSSLQVVEVHFLSEHGPQVLAAVAVVLPLFILQGMFSAGAIGGAISGSVARALGAGDKPRASALLASALLIAVIGSCLMALLVIQWGHHIYRWAGAEEALLPLAQEYAWWVFIAQPAYWLLNMLCSVLRGTGDMKRPAWAMSVTVLSYAVWAYLLLPATDASDFAVMQSAGQAMALSFLFGLLSVLLLYQFGERPIALNLADFNLAILRAVLRQGLLAASQSLMTIAYSLIATALFARYGLYWLAGYGLSVRLELIMVPVIFGIGGALIALVGAYVGAGRRAEAIAIAWRGILVNVVIVGGIGLVLAIWPSLWCQPMSDGETTAQHCEASLRVIGPSYGFFALGLGLYFASQGLNTLIYPVAGAALRLLIVLAAFWFTTNSTPPSTLLWIVAAAVLSYGGVTAMALAFGPWRK